MNPELPTPAALVGALGYVLLQLVAPISVSAGMLTLSAWLVPLAAVLLWPRQAGTVLSVLLLLLIGTGVDFATGLQLGTSALAALVVFALSRPDRAEGERSGWAQWLRFAALALAAVGALMLVSGGWRKPAPLLLDALVAILAFPVAFLFLRLLRGVGGEDRREVFP